MKKLKNIQPTANICIKFNRRKDKNNKNSSIISIEDKKF